MRKGSNAHRVQIVHKDVGNAVLLQFSSTIFSDDPLSFLTHRVLKTPARVAGSLPNRHLTQKDPIMKPTIALVDAERRQIHLVQPPDTHQRRACA